MWSNDRKLSSEQQQQAKESTLTEHHQHQQQLQQQQHQNEQVVILEWGGGIEGTATEVEHERMMPLNKLPIRNLWENGGQIFLLHSVDDNEEADSIRNRLVRRCWVWNLNWKKNVPSSRSPPLNLRTPSLLLFLIIVFCFLYKVVLGFRIANIL